MTEKREEAHESLPLNIGGERKKRLQRTGWGVAAKSPFIGDAEYF